MSTNLCTRESAAEALFGGTLEELTHLAEPGLLDDLAALPTAASTPTFLPTAGSTPTFLPTAASTPTFLPTAGSTPTYLPVD